MNFGVGRLGGLLGSRLARTASMAALVLVALAAGAAEQPVAAPAPRLGLPIPPMPSLSPSGPPPADPWPSLYRGPAPPAQRWLLTVVAAPKPPELKSGQPCTIQPRPHDVVQAPGDPKPIEGTIREEREGKISFYDLKGIGHPKNPLVAANLVVFKRQAATVQEALRERVQAAGNDAAAHLAIAQECLDGDLVAEAEAALKRALALDPKSLAALAKLADLYVVQGKLDAEIGVYETALAAGADSPELRERFGQRCFELDLYALAANHFASGFALAAKAPVADVAAGKAPLPDAPLARRLLRGLAEVCVAEGRAADAAPLLDALAKLAPEDPAVRNVQALADLLAGHTEKALQTLRSVVEGADPPASARNNLGAILLNTGDAQAALEGFEACRAAFPGHIKATLNAALASAALSKLDDARKLLATFAPAPADSLSYALAAGYVAERQGDWDAAAKAYRQAGALDRGCALAVQGLARCFLAKGDLKSATETFEQALPLAPGDPEALRGLGACHFRAGLFGRAADVFRTLAAREGADPADLVRFGLSLLHAKDIAQAAGVLDKAVAAGGPAAPYALIARAWAADVEGAAARAEALFRQAQHAPEPSEATKYAADAVRRIFAARGEEFAVVRFAGAAALPEGWRAAGEGSPSPELRPDGLRFDGRSTAPNERSVIRPVPVESADDTGATRRFLRFDIEATVPLTNDATVGVLVGAAGTTLQLALRTTRQPQLSRRLAYRLVRGQAPTPWADLPGTIALERVRIGLGLSPRAADALDVRLDGRVVGEPIPLDALHDLPPELRIGIFAAVDPGQQCLFAVREAELVWKKAAPERNAPKPEGKE